MGVGWWDIVATRRILQDLPSKFFKELKGLLSCMWPSVILKKHYPIRELVPTLVLDDLFEPQQHVAVLLSISSCTSIVDSWGLEVLHHQKINWASHFQLSGQSGIFQNSLTRKATMLPFHAHLFGGRVKVVTPTSITHHNLKINK